MKIKISQKNINIIEDFITNDNIKKSDIFKTPCISLEYYDDMRETWTLIQNDDKNSYYYFASNGGGMNSYGFYKANNGKIYIVDAFINDIRSIYMITDNFHFLKDMDKFDMNNKYSCEL